MPGGGAGGGSPPKKHCPRCGRESLDELSSWLGFLTALLTAPIAFGLFQAVRWIEVYGAALGALTFVAIVLLGFGIYGSAVGAHAIAQRAGWQHRCPHCAFAWLPYLRQDELRVALRDRVLAGLFERGFRALAPESGSGELFRLEGEEQGRRVIMIQKKQVGPGRLQIALAVAHGATLSDGERGEILEAGAKLERSIDDLVPQHVFESLSLGDGELRLALRASPVDGRDMETLLRLMADAAPSFERVALEVHGVERRAFARAGVPRCGYCHEDVTGREPDLVACERCATVLHAGCWEELGHCPVMGCKGHERARETS